MQPSKHDQNFVIILPPKHKIRPKCPSSFLCCILPTVHFPSPYLLHFQRFTLLRCYLYQKDERVVWEPSEPQTFRSVPVIQPLTAHHHQHTHTHTHTHTHRVSSVSLHSSESSAYTSMGRELMPLVLRAGRSDKYISILTLQICNS